MNNYVKIYKSLTTIPERKYQGYIWCSGKDKPEVLEEYKSFKFPEIQTNPFIVEALLYCKEKNVSVMVRHTGNYQIREYDLNSLPEGYELEEKKYIPHRLDSGGKKVCLKQLWLPEKDPNCEGMEVLTLKAHIFTGFSK